MWLSGKSADFSQLGGRLISFVKAHACGNDFLIVDAQSVDPAERSPLAVKLCSRNTGIGADGVEYFEWTGERSGRVHLINADGSVAEISGNGTRCVAGWMAWKRRATLGAVFSIETDAGIRQCSIKGGDGSRFEIATGMGVPVVREKTVTLASGLQIPGATVSMGNPQFVTFVDEKEFAIAGSAWEAVGREICFHSDFPHQTNVEFVRVIGTNQIEIRIFERGVGPTASSGTGTCASAAASIALRGVKAELLVSAPGGSQGVRWDSPAAEMILTGPAELIAIGEAF
jgi:diaminopimelate epimerase